MSKFVYYTREEKELARTTDIASLLKENGEKLKRAGKEMQWRDGSDKVSIRGNLWYHQYDQEGGDAIEFVRRFFGKDYQDAMEYLLHRQYGALRQPQKSKQEKKFELPKANENMRRAYAYLVKNRGIKRDVVSAFVNQKMIYESSEHHNVVFVGYDNTGKPCHAHKRGTGSQSTFKCNAEGSVPEYSFNWNGTSDKIYFFEAPIDMLSYISMYPNDWKENTYVAACSVSDRALFQCLKDNPQIRNVYLCLDNDEAGQKAVSRISEKLFVEGYNTEVLTPSYKDWNEDLNHLMEDGEQEWVIQ